MDPARGDRHETLVCRLHTDEELCERGLDDLWGGRGTALSTSLFEDGCGHLIQAWDQMGGALALHFLLSTGDLHTVTCWGSPDVCAARLSRSERSLSTPYGVPVIDREPWRTAVAERWVLKAIRMLPNTALEIAFADEGTLTISTAMVTWGELGGFRRVLEEDWRACRRPAKDATSR